MADIGRRPATVGFWLRGGLIAAGALTLAACQTASGYDKNGDLTTTTPTAKPNFPVRESPVAPQQPAPRAEAPTPTPPPPAVVATPEVRSQPLPPPPAAQPAPPPPPPVQAAAPPPPAPMVRAAPPAPEPRYTVTGKVVETEGKPKIYVVKKGQGVDAIARDLDTTRKVLVDENNLKAPYHLKPGQKLKGPATRAKAYVVQSGDTLFSISKRFNVSVKELAAYNNLKPTASIKNSQKVLLPAGFKDKGPVLVTGAAAAAMPAPQSAPPLRRSQATEPSNPPPSGNTYARPSATPSSPVTSPPPAPYLPQARPTPPAPPAASKGNPPQGAGGTIIERSAAATAAQIRAAGAGKFIWPIKGRVLLGFGPSGDGQRNDGINIAAPMNASVRAAAAGEVIYAGDVLKEYGNLVLVQHADGFVTAYGHLSKILVKMKDKVSQNQELGEVGQTGGVSQPQLHFETRYARTAADSPAPPVDPMLVLPGQ